MKSKAIQILLNLFQMAPIKSSSYNSKKQVQRIKDGVAFIEASRLNGMKDEDIHAFLDHFKDRKQSKIIYHILKFEETLNILTEETLTELGSK